MGASKQLNNKTIRNKMKKKSYSLLVVGSTQDSKEAGQSSFKRYVGIGSSYVLAVCPSKEELEKLENREIANAPEYLVHDDQGDRVDITFVFKLDPEVHEGAEGTNRGMITLRNAPAYNRDQTKVQVIDKYGNFAWANVEDAKAHKKLFTSSGAESKMDASYRVARVGECALVDFLKNYLNIPDAFNYVNGSWVKKADAEAAKGEFMLEHFEDYFKGDFSEIKEALMLQPNNKIKLLYGVRTTDDNKQYQSVCLREQMTMKNGTGANGYTRVERQLADAKSRGSFANINYAVQELAEYKVEATPIPDAAPAAPSTDFDW